MTVFDEAALRAELVRVWGESGAHVEVFDMLLKGFRMRCLAPTPEDSACTCCNHRWNFQAGNLTEEYK